MSPICTIVLLLSLVATSLAAGLPYIIGGDRVTNDEYWPWQGSLHKRFGDFVCGCSLISREWAVTAASCVQNQPYDVRFGSIMKSQGTVRAVHEIIVHEYYSVSGIVIHNNVAVLKFSPLELSYSIDTIKLGVTDEVENEQCYITGWGVKDDSDVSLPEFLHQANMQVIGNDVCADDWTSNINGSNVCTDKTGSPGTCRGDTGGPLVCYKGDHYELVGISSYQDSTCDGSYHPVYSRVSIYKQWIEAKTGIEHRQIDP